MSHNTHGYKPRCSSPCASEMDRAAFFKRLEEAARVRLDDDAAGDDATESQHNSNNNNNNKKRNNQSGADGGGGGGSVIVGRNFSFVKVLNCSSSVAGIDFEVKCVGKGHPGLFSNQSYILKALFNFQENGGANYTQIGIKVEPHPNIARYFCRFQDTIPLEFYDPLPASAKEMVMMCDPHVLNGGTKSRLLTWIVLEHHPDTLRNFLLKTVAPLAYTTTTETATTTPWSIVHKYSRDISAALVHLFNNKVIHFNLTLDTIAVSSNNEQVILTDLVGHTMKFDDEGNKTPRFTKLVSEFVFAPPLKNTSLVAPEILNAISSQHGGFVNCEMQGSFELGCILFEFAMGAVGQQHPPLLPGYPDNFRNESDGLIHFELESEESFPIQPPAFPKKFCDLVRGLLQFEPSKRTPLVDAHRFLMDIIEPPTPDELLSFYTHVVTHAGSPWSIHKLAECYYKGIGAKQDLQKAAALFQQALDAGCTSSANDLGSCYLHGQGVDKDTARAAELYQRGAEAGLSDAIHNLAECYWNGTGVERDPRQAAELYQLALDSGHTGSAFDIGFCYHSGIGADWDEAKAAALFQRAADDGHAKAMNYLGDCFFWGNGVVKDTKKALGLFYQAASCGDHNSRYILGACFLDGTGVGTVDVRTAVKFIRLVAAENDPLAQKVLRRICSMCSGESDDEELSSDDDSSDDGL
ncbi:calmodulin-dependent protein kinase [Pelomyxa schiedti]|nr:calmodulin-dependent protein kinase [Pelomyxa schiedti]